MKFLNFSTAYYLPTAKPPITLDVKLNTTSIVKRSHQDNVYRITWDFTGEFCGFCLLVMFNTASGKMRRNHFPCTLCKTKITYFLER